MEGYNKVVLIGTLGADAEVKTLENGNAVANMSIAVNESYTDKTTGERRTKTEWINIEAWRNLANFLGQFGKKGTSFLVEGRLKTDTWEHEGNTRKLTKVVADVIKFTGPRPATQQSTAQQPVAQQPVAQQPVAQQPVAQQPVAQQPVAQQPVAQQPVAQQQVTPVVSNNEFMDGMSNSQDDDLPF